MDGLGASVEFEEERRIADCGFRPTVSRRLASPGVPWKLRRRTDDFRKNGHFLKYPIKKRHYKHHKYSKEPLQKTFRQKLLFLSAEWR